MRHFRAPGDGASKRDCSKVCASPPRIDRSWTLRSNCGYRSWSAFTAMFRRTLGKTPS